jgi:hypothetical protein
MPAPRSIRSRRPRCGRSLAARPRRGAVRNRRHHPPNSRRRHPELGRRGQFSRVEGHPVARQRGTGEARQAKAEREKRAKIIAAEGESMAAAALWDASDTVMAHLLAPPLRNLQTLIDLDVDKTPRSCSSASDDCDLRTRRLPRPGNRRGRIHALAPDQAHRACAGRSPAPRPAPKPTTSGSRPLLTLSLRPPASPARAGQRPAEERAPPSRRVRCVTNDVSPHTGPCAGAPTIPFRRNAGGTQNPKSVM